MANTDVSAKSQDEQYNGSFSNVNLHHTSRDHLQRLQQVILKSTLVGGLYGAMIAIPSDLLLRWRSPLYRAFGWRIRVFYYTIWVSAAAAFKAEGEVIGFENQVRREEEERRRQLLELSVLQGIYSPENEGFKSKKA
jgi:hypothetical protein